MTSILTLTDLDVGDLVSYSSDIFSGVGLITSIDPNLPLAWQWSCQVSWFTSSRGEYSRIKNVESCYGPSELTLLQKLR